MNVIVITIINSTEENKSKELQVNKYISKNNEVSVSQLLYKKNPFDFELLSCIISIHWSKFICRLNQLGLTSPN